MIDGIPKERVIGIGISIPKGEATGWAWSRKNNRDRKTRKSSDI